MLGDRCMATTYAEKSALVATRDEYHPALMRRNRLRPIVDEGAKDGFKEPKGGDQWVPNPKGNRYGWKDADGNV